MKLFLSALLLLSTPFAKAQTCEVNQQAVRAVLAGCGEYQDNDKKTISCYRNAMKALGEGLPLPNLILAACPKVAISEVPADCILNAVKASENKPLYDVINQHDCVKRSQSIGNRLMSLEGRDPENCLRENLKNYVSAHKIKNSGGNAKSAKATN